MDSVARSTPQRSQLCSLERVEQTACYVIGQADRITWSPSTLTEGKHSSQVSAGSQDATWPLSLLTLCVAAALQYEHQHKAVSHSGFCVHICCELLGSVYGTSLRAPLQRRSNAAPTPRSARQSLLQTWRLNEERFSCRRFSHNINSLSAPSAQLHSFCRFHFIASEM